MYLYINLIYPQNIFSMDLSCRIKRKIEVASMKILSAKSSPVISICNNAYFIREREREFKIIDRR